MEDLAARIEQAKHLLNDVRFAAMATVNEDGTPHNTPYFFMYDETITHLYWGRGAIRCIPKTSCGRVMSLLFCTIL
jgi:hypothetical protein